MRKKRPRLSLRPPVRRLRRGPPSQKRNFHMEEEEDPPETGIQFDKCRREERRERVRERVRTEKKPNRVRIRRR